MNSKPIILIIVLIVATYCNAQQKVTNNFDTSRQTLLANGIYIENFNLTLLWHAKHSDLIAYDRPRIEKGKQNFQWLIWDSAKIFNGINIRLEIFSGHGYSKLTTVYGRIDSMDFDRVKSFLERLTSTPGKLTDSKQHTFYFWTINNCRIRLGSAKGKYKSRVRNPFSLDFQLI